MYEVAVRLPLTTILVQGPLEKLIEFFSRSPTSYYVRRTDMGRSVFSLLVAPCLVSVTMLERSQTLGDSTASLASLETC